ncbi:MAG: YkgJ family cysteine cluster protein [Deltaproteobacteria bacterium]|nr:YkgJ family cysteine cluster protein [Deltaproteobacteria bacterium]
MKTFDCKMCGECCYGEGGINVNEEEVERIARFLDISPEAFISGYCRELNGRLTIRTGPDYFCIFFDQEKACLIHPVKPAICSQWPYYPANLTDKDTWEMAKQACPGINPESSFKEFREEGGQNLKSSTKDQTNG